jgi:aspartyl-tRNA synthetase
MMRTHTLGELRKNNIEETVILTGWVFHRRDHGGIIFIDLKDRYGVTQIVFDPNIFPIPHKKADKIRSQWVLKITGKVRFRGENLVNKNLKTGEIEIIVSDLEILSESKTPPFELDTNQDVREDLRLEYRYLDLRRDKMMKNLKLRHNVNHVIRNYYNNLDFLEVETPIMIKGTPEGSREYLVPSRLHHGEFYVLPQSPQQLKQLSMLGGIDKYYQIARCFRDEDLRGDRQPEFTQLDMEMSFCEEKDIIENIENLFYDLTKKCIPTKNWEKYLINNKFRRITWREAIENYGSDKPDIRFDMTFSNLSVEGKTSGFSIFEKSDYIFSLNAKKEYGSLTRKDIDNLTKLAQQNGAGGLAWLRVGEESGPVAKNSNKEFLNKIIEKNNATEGDLIFFGAGEFLKATEPLGAVRSKLGDMFNLKNKDDFAYLWVTEFPLFEKKDDGSIQSAHHPFTMPHKKDIDLLETDPLKVRSYTYDIVANGVELGGGSIRIHDSKLQNKMFDVLGLSKEDTELRFGHILKAFQYGCPPHGGCALGLDRIIMLFANESTIREVIAFPKDQSAKDLMLKAPSNMSKEQLEEQNIRLTPIIK